MTPNAWLPTSRDRHIEVVIVRMIQEAEHPGGASMRQACSGSGRENGCKRSLLEGVRSARQPPDRGLYSFDEMATGKAVDHVIWDAACPDNGQRHEPVVRRRDVEHLRFMTHPVMSSRPL